jgi:hypothetical protein
MMYMTVIENLVLLRRRPEQKRRLLRRQQPRFAEKYL